MKIRNLIHIFENTFKKTHLPNIRVGDNVVVKTILNENNKTRIQAFKGLVIGTKNRGLRSSIRVRKVLGTEGVEKTFFLHSPKVQDVTVEKQYKVRRAKLYFLRKLVGKQTRLKTK
jgi:large subunit ribosomal protein L19